MPRGIFSAARRDVPPGVDGKFVREDEAAFYEGVERVTTKARGLDNQSPPSGAEMSLFRRTGR